MKKIRKSLITLLLLLSLFITIGSVSAATNETNTLTDDHTTHKIADQGENIESSPAASPTKSTSEADPTLNVTKGSWDIIGLDQNKPETEGPNQYLVQIRINNNDTLTATNVTANFTFTTYNQYINLAPGETAIKNLGDIQPGTTAYAFYLINVTRTTNAHLTSRNYTVTVSGTNTPTYTITGQLYVEKLISQNRNQVISITASNNTPAMGSIITITMISTTASTYDIVNLPLAYNPTILQPLNVTTSYATKTTNNVSIINPGATNFLSVWYFKVIGTGTTEIYGIITDRSGSSYHYNGDYGKNITIEVPSADIGIRKTVNNTAPRYGDTIKFTLNATNIGPNTAENVVVVDLLPTGLTYLGSNPTGIWDALTRTITWNLGTMAVGSSQTLEIIAQVATTNAVLINTATITGTVYDPYLANNTAEATVTIAPEADLGITKTVNNTKPNYHEIVRFTIIVCNNGPDTAINVIVKDVLPAGLILQSAVASQGTYSSGVWKIGTLAVGETATLNIKAFINRTGSMDNIAKVKSDTYDPYIANNTAKATIRVPLAANLEIRKSVDNATPNYGESITFTIWVFNKGPDVALNTIVVDRLSAAMEYVSSSASVGSYDPMTGLWVIGDLPAGSSAVLRMVVKVMMVGVFENVATVSSESYGEKKMSRVEVRVTKPAPKPSPVPPKPSPVPCPPGKVPMQPTGAPLALMLLAVLLVVIGQVIPWKK